MACIHRSHLDHRCQADLCRRHVQAAVREAAEARKPGHLQLTAGRLRHAASGLRGGSIRPTRAGRTMFAMQTAPTPQTRTLRKCRFVASQLPLERLEWHQLLQSHCQKQTPRQSSPVIHFHMDCVCDTHAGADWCDD